MNNKITNDGGKENLNRLGIEWFISGPATNPTSELISSNLGYPRVPTP